MSPTLPDPHHPTSEELFAYRDGELPADRRVLVEAHVLACAQCRDRIDEMSTSEAMLRRTPDGAGEEYFERMTDSVMARVGAAGREGAGVGATRVAPGGAPAPGGGGYVEVPRVERRRPDSSGEDQEPRRRLRLSWIGISGSAAAAVAVVVAVVMLFHRQSEWLQAPRPAVVGEPRASAPAESALGDATGQVAGEAAGTRANGKPKAPPAREKSILAKRTDRPLSSATKQEEVGALRDQAQEKKDQVFREKAAIIPPSAGTAPEAQASLKAMAREPARVQGLAQNEARPGSDYANVLRAYRLPPLWNPAVPSDAVARAANDLRYLYQTGHAGADSARIRLYLAEAERARLNDPSNTAAVESISHHYRRAISLAGGDAALAATARRRLLEFEQEMMRTRGTQP